MCPSCCRRVFAPILLACVVVLCAGAASGQQLVLHPRIDSSIVSRGSILPHYGIQRPRVALVLSGGGSRGIAQIGVLKALEAYQIPVDFIVGTSMGAIIGGLYAAGETPRELDSLVTATNWDDVLALDDDTRRRDLFVDQKAADDRSFLAVRFQGVDPVIPSSVSSGQRLTDFLSTQVLRAPYHPYQSFDQLKIPFRAVATDLVSGQRVVMKDGSFAQALRASATVPMIYTPIERNGMRLIDGGLTANIPVDVARGAGYDVVIVVNSTSGLRNANELNAPWQTADQIMGIMMGLLNEDQLRNADVVITPDLGRHVGTNFAGLDSLMMRGYEATVAQMPEIKRLIEERKNESGIDGIPNESLGKPAVYSVGASLPETLWSAIQTEAQFGVLTPERVQEFIDEAYETGDYSDITAAINQDSVSSSVTITSRKNPFIRSVTIDGCSASREDSLRRMFSPLIGNPFNHRTVDKACERLIRVYRNHGYSLAGIDTVEFDENSGNLRVDVNEGIIYRLDVQGGVRSQDAFVLLEFPLHEGEVFQIDKARRGIANLNGTTLFEYVYLEVTYQDRLPLVTIRLRERPSQLVRFGIRGDDERNLQGLIDLRDVNFRGTGTELGLMISGGQRNSDFSLEYKSRRLFDTYITFDVNGFYRTLDSYVYEDAPPEQENRWNRVVAGEYRDIRYGAGISLGSQLERLGNFTVELLYQDVRLKNLDRVAKLEERYTLGMVKVGTAVDTKDVYPFTTAGIGLDLSYEFAFEGLGGDIGYNSLRLMYESYNSWTSRITFHPKFTLGFADKTMPLSQQFRLGGRDSFFGVREDDRRGRQLLLVNLEYRYFLPVRLFFDTYLRLRYDLGTISAVPEEIKFSTLRHGIGAELALRTPIGPASIGVGKSFYFGRDLPNNPLQQGPFLVYFMIGYQM